MADFYQTSFGKYGNEHEIIGIITKRKNYF